MSHPSTSTKPESSGINQYQSKVLKYSDEDQPQQIRNGFSTLSYRADLVFSRIREGKRALKELNGILELTSESYDQIADKMIDYMHSAVLVPYEKRKKMVVSAMVKLKKKFPGKKPQHDPLGEHCPSAAKERHDREVKKTTDTLSIHFRNPQRPVFDALVRRILEMGKMYKSAAQKIRDGLIPRLSRVKNELKVAGEKAKSEYEDLVKDMYNYANNTNKYRKYTEKALLKLRKAIEKTQKVHHDSKRYPSLISSTKDAYFEYKDAKEAFLTQLSFLLQKNREFEDSSSLML
ncbi:hypothetical protein ADUPG1_010290, partial [Aduncisulcus paluster]